MKLRTLASVAALVALVPVSQAVVWAHTLTGGQSRTFGTTDSRFGGVVIIETGGSFGTGTFIGRGNGSAWFLTADHVITAGNAGTIRYETGPSWTIQQVIKPSAADFSLVRVANFNLNPIQLGLNTAPIVNGTQFVSAGYGGFGNQSTGGPWDFSQKLHGFTSRVTSTQNTNWSGYTGTTITDTFDAPNSANFTSIEGFGAPGDSGSSLINSNNEILGVLSHGDFETYGNRNWYYALTPTIVNAIYTQTGITPIPEPMTLGVLALAALVARRRKKK